MSQEWELMASLHGFLLASTIVKYVEEDRRFEIVTPYQDSSGRVVVYATIDGDQIRVTDNGHLYNNFLRHQDVGGAFHIEMGVPDDGDDNGVRREENEFVIYCTVENFGKAVVSLAHTVILIGTGKATMLTMLQVFQSILGRLGFTAQNDSPDEQEEAHKAPVFSSGGWPGGTPFEA